MSEQGSTTTNTNENESAAADLLARYEAKGKVVALATDDQEAFLAFSDTIGTANYVNWLEGADNEVFTGLAMVRAENQANRLIPIASEDAVFGTGGDPSVRKALYRVYVNRVVNTAGENDATAAQFITIGGCFKQKFDLDAFKSQAKLLCKVLRKSGVNGITNSALRLSFSSAAFAKTQFPRVPEESWLKIIGLAKSSAEKAGYDISIYDHWIATRAVQTAEASMIELNFADFEAAENEAASEEGEAETSTTPATTPTA